MALTRKYYTSGESRGRGESQPFLTLLRKTGREGRNIDKIHEVNTKLKNEKQRHVNSREVFLRTLLAISWERKRSTHMQKIHKTEMVGYTFPKGVPCFESLQVLSGKQIVIIITEGRKEAKGARGWRFSLSKVLGPIGEQKEARVKYNRPRQ